VNIDGVRNVAYFEFIKVVDDNQPYQMLMGIEWAFDNQAIINMKRRENIFEVGEMKITTPLDPKEGRRYIESMKGDEIDNLYNMTVRMEEYLNPIADIVLIWRYICLCTSDTQSGLENW
jgi:hypothetical protein